MLDCVNCVDGMVKNGKKIIFTMSDKLNYCLFNRYMFIELVQERSQNVEYYGLAGNPVDYTCKDGTGKYTNLSLVHAESLLKQHVCRLWKKKKKKGKSFLDNKGKNSNVV